jgi:D-glycero-D-manno-heptose 1,7-bisphosphate phosphatase
MPRSARAATPAPLPCVFLDRDGTVSKEAGYINHPDRIELIPGSAAAIRRLNENGVLAVVTTNQSGVARGYITEPVLRKVHRRLGELLARRGARLDAIYYAPNHKDAKIDRYRLEDGLRKPDIGMIQKARGRFPIDLARSYVVGDKITDVEMARRAGIKGVFVLSGYGLGEYTYQRKAWTCRPDFIARDLREAVDWILKDLKGAKNRSWNPARASTRPVRRNRKS